MESHLRCRCHIDQYPEVSRPIRAQQGWLVMAGVATHKLTLLSPSLLNDPNTSSPANVEASNLYKDNRREYTKRVRETVEKSWDD